MRLLALSAALLMAAAPGAEVRFEADGVRVGDRLVEGAVLEFVDGSAGAFLVSGTCFEPLSAAMEISLAPGRSITVEPGVRVKRIEAGFQLTAHGDARVRLATDSGEIILPTPVTISWNEQGWVLSDGTVLPFSSLNAGSLAPLQDDKKPGTGGAGQSRSKGTGRGTGGGAKGGMKAVFQTVGNFTNKSERSEDNAVKFLTSTSETGF